MKAADPRTNQRVGLMLSAVNRTHGLCHCLPTEGWCVLRIDLVGCCVAVGGFVRDGQAHRRGKDGRGHLKDQG